MHLHDVVDEVSVVILIHHFCQNKTPVNNAVEVHYCDGEYKKLFNGLVDPLAPLCLETGTQTGP